MNRTGAPANSRTVTGHIERSKRSYSCLNHGSNTRFIADIRGEYRCLATHFLNRVDGFLRCRLVEINDQDARAL